MLLVKKAKPKKNKSKQKRQRTFTSSEFSLLEDKQLSCNEIFRNDVLKRKTQPKPNKSQKQLTATKKRTKSRSKCRLDKCQTYQVIPYKNSLNSEIIFSNEDTKRERTMDETMSEQIAIRVNQQYAVDSNRQLRISIKKEYQKKVEAAIKIQKVFRGFLTRKILLKYVQQEQKTLSEKLAHHRSESVSEHSSYFNDKQNIQSKRRVMSQQQGVFEYSNQHDNEEEEEESEDQINMAVYRHHDPIYLHAQDSENLYSDQEEDFNQQTYFPIIEVPGEYIDSRKSSSQQSEPRNKLSRPQQPQIQQIQEQEPPLTPNNPPISDQLNLTKTQKKGQRERSKPNRSQDDFIQDNTVKLLQQNQQINNNIPHFLQSVDNNATLRDKDSFKKTEERSAEKDWSNLQRLKQAQMMRWSEIIQLVQSQISKTTDSNDLNDCMKKIMEMSIKNRQILQLQPQMYENSSSSLFLQTSIPKIDSMSKLKKIKAERQYLNHLHLEGEDLLLGDDVRSQNQEMEQMKIQFEQNLRKHQEGIQPQRKKENMFLSDKTFFFDPSQMKRQVQEKGSDVPASLHSPMSSFENTGQMKKFLAGNIQEQTIEEMLKLREDTVRTREIDEMKALKLSLETGTISQSDFLDEIEDITRRYALEKTSIEKTKEDITKGYQATMKLTKDAFQYAKKQGYNLPISRSLEGLRYKSPTILSDIIIDQLVQLKRQTKNKPQENNRDNNLSQEEDQESSLQFTQEELKRFRRAQPHDIEFASQIADLNRNMMITQSLFRQQQLQDDQNILMKTQHVHRQLYEIEQASSPPKNDPQVQKLTDVVMDRVIYELAGELLIKPLFSEKLIDKNHFFKPKPVSDKERLKFIQLLQKHFPSISELNFKLNQKICPLPTQLLRCMRIDFSDDDQDDNSYEEIGKYEFIIGQDICNQAIKDFLEQIQTQNPHSKPSIEQLDDMSSKYELNERVYKYVEQRQKYIANRKNHTKELRWEVLNIQIHCIFDAWNEELIYLRSQKAGYSGIGLNQLTLSIKDHNCLVPMEETTIIVREGKERLIDSLGHSSPAMVFPRVLDDDEIDQLQNDSRWIFYSDQALSYGLQLVYLIEQQIFNEMGKQLRKRMLHFLSI